jgi:hypothetical protein
LESFVKQFHNIMSRDTSGRESLGPLIKDSRVDAGLLHREGKGESQFIGQCFVNPEFLHEILNAERKKVKKLQQECRATRNRNTKRREREKSVNNVK